MLSWGSRSPNNYDNIAVPRDGGTELTKLLCYEAISAVKFASTVKLSNNRGLLPTLSDKVQHDLSIAHKNILCSIITHSISLSRRCTVLGPQTDVKRTPSAWNASKRIKSGVKCSLNQ